MKDNEGLPLLLKKQSTVGSIKNHINNNQKVFESLDQISFCVFECEKLIGRENVLPVVTFKILENLGITQFIDTDKLSCFLDRIYMKYSRTVQYHNDLHGIDITQMGYRLLTHGNLASILKLS